MSPEGVNSILSAPTDTKDALKESRNSVLSGPPLQAEHTIPTNKFSYCEITSRPDGSSTAQDQVYTDTDPEGRLAIYTDILVRPHKTAKVTNMEVKVDPGAEARLMPVCHFRRLFPQLCLNGQPKEGVLQKADSRFESYSGDSVQIQGHITFQVQNIQTRRYRPIRFYVNDRESGPVLLGHAACHWLGMITVQCFNKARVHKKFIASVSKDGPEKSSSSDKKSGPLRSKQDTYTDTGRLKNQVAKARAKKHRRRSAVNLWTDVTDGKSDTEPQPAASKEREPSKDSSDYSVLSEPECPQDEKAPRVALDGPLRSTDSISTRKKKYWKPTKGAKTYYMNSECQLQCREDPQDVTSMASTKELPLSRLKPIYHEPKGMLITDTDHLKQLYPNSFDTLGSLRGEYDIKIDPNVAPVVQARRKVPIESREPIEAEIESLIQQDVLEEQIEPTPWVNSATYPMKPNGQVRVCLDCQPLNKAIIREHHKAPTVEEIAHELAGAQFFTKADAHKAFLQIHLTPRARLLTVFNWHKGRLRYKRMPFGAKMSQDVFQMRMDQILEKCPGVIGIHNDVVIHGKTREEHDANLVNFLNVCQEEGLTLNGKKLELRKEEITFFGALFTKEGMRPDPKKLQGIEDLTPPADKQQLQSFLGMVTYMGEFIPHLSHHTQPLRALLKKDTVFYWDEQINRSFQQLKHILREASSTPLRYYDRNLPVTVQADASIRGLGACLIQNGRPIAFASKSLTDAETRYANIERELLAVIFACLRFNTYLQGRQFTVESDHKPLEMIHLKAISNAPPRLQRMLLQLQKYDMTIKYRPGPEMLLADGLSRCPVRSNPEIKLDLRVDYIAFNRAWIETLKTETIGDPVLGVVHQLTYNGWPKERRKVPRIARHYWDFRDELSTDDSLLLKGPRIVIPGELRETYLRRLHEGHLSAKKVQENARYHVYWPGWEADISDYTMRCQECIKRSRPAKEPLQPHDIPEGPWRKIGMDFFDFKGIGQDGRHYTVQFEETGQRLQRTRCHIKPLGPDIPQLHPSFLSGKVPNVNQNSDLSAAGERRGEVTTRNEAQNSVLSGPTKANSTAPVLVSGKKVTFNQRDQVHDIPARQPVQHTVIDPRDPDLTIRLRPSPEDTERDDDTVPDVPPTESSAASETDGTSDPDTDRSSSEDATSSDTGTSDSSSDSSPSKSSSSSGSEPSSPVRASTPSAGTATGQQEQITPTTADTSMQARQFYGEMLGRPLTRKEFKRQKTQFGRQLAILQQVSRRPENQLPTHEPKEPKPGTSKDSTDNDSSESSRAKPPPRKKNNNR